MKHDLPSHSEIRVKFLNWIGLPENADKTYNYGSLRNCVVGQFMRAIYNVCWRDHSDPTPDYPGDSYEAALRGQIMNATHQTFENDIPSDASRSHLLQRHERSESNPSGSFGTLFKDITENHPQLFT